MTSTLLDLSGKLSPDAEGVIMTTLGFAEAYAHAVKVLIGGNTTIAVCSPCGLALLKLITWDERRERKDASDRRHCCITTWQSETKRGFLTNTRTCSICPITNWQAQECWAAISTCC